MLLPQSDLASLTLLGEQLKSSLSSVISGLPERSQSISGLSEHLKYNRSNCQRILNAINENKEGIEVICLLPGISGLTDFCEKSAIYMKKKEDRQLLSLITEFQGRIKQYARSHTELKRILSRNDHPKKKKTISAEKDKQACLYQYGIQQKN